MERDNERDPHSGAESDQDAAWRAIVENFGERADLGPDDLHDRIEQSEPAATSTTWSIQDADPLGLLPSSAPPPVDDDERFVPPEPPPVPRPPFDRGLAWAGVFGAPTLLIVLLIGRIHVPTWVAYGGIAWFVGGFGYLVAQMSREPRDPWDDGSRL
ncbi:hypothetical protein [Nocardioides acrostichi]|uniref:Uncharacterized protein n=1 Tax=Nocardioides acrostichi TaxID=2784339 RepID=A0A930UTJ3_9ACTN|nr:hypothetical protein [Nocardioides acrostichi]MBF4160573.1 hypothetical protein [Nocardioides acrostichi]